MKTVKKILMSLILLAGVMTPQSALAFGKGEKSLGVMGGYATYNNGGYAGIGFQWEFANHFRLSPDLGYVFQNRYKSGFVVNADMQFPFKIVRGFGVYPLAGITVNNWHYTNSGNATRVGFNFGAGFDVYFTSNLKLTIQGKYSLLKDTDGGFFGAGLSYIF